MHNLLLINRLNFHSVKWEFEDTLFLIGVSIIFIGLLYLSKKKPPKSHSATGETTKEETIRRVQQEGVEMQISAIYGTYEVNQKLSLEMLHEQKENMLEKEARKQQQKTTEESLRSSDDQEVRDNPEVFVGFLTDINSEDENMMIMNPHYMEDILSEVEEGDEDNTGDEGDSSSSVNVEFPLPATLEQKRSTRFRSLNNMQGAVKGAISKVHEERRETTLSGSHGGIF